MAPFVPCMPSQDPKGVRRHRAGSRYAFSAPSLIVVSGVVLHATALDATVPDATALVASSPLGVSLQSFLESGVAGQVSLQREVAVDVVGQAARQHVPVARGGAPGGCVGAAAPHEGGYGSSQEASVPPRFFRVCTFLTLESGAELHRIGVARGGYARRAPRERVGRCVAMLFVLFRLCCSRSGCV